MSNIQSYNALIDRFKAFAKGHFILKRFSHGQIEVSDLEKFGEYPFMHVVPSNVSYAKGTKTFSFQIVLADMPRDKEDKSEYQREVLSDLQRIAEDLIAEITNHRVLFGDLITVQNVTLEPFLEEFQHTLTGWTISLDLLVPYYWDACSIPAEWNDMFESSTGGSGSILTFIDSITRDDNGFVSLVNDEANPEPGYYYGTNDEGVRGWYLTTDNVGLTCETIGDCQTIIDIESAIDDLQTEILLKANTADISAVGFSNDYNDLDNKPTIPAAQVNSDWNATSGVAEILNKPSLPATVGDMLKSVYDTDVDGVVDSAERIQIVVRNSTGSTLTKGQIVYLSGATGNRPNAVLAQANTEATSSKTIGMVIANIANNTDGQVAVNGTLHDLDTSAFTAGDTLWLSATTAGGMVANTPPVEPNHAVFIGYVTRSHPNLGRIVLAIQNGYELDELHGVQITTPTDNQALVYESASSLWKNESVDKTFVGLGNVDNTSDANKPVSTATQTALNLKENTANKQNSLATDGTGVKFPTVDAVNNLSFIDKFKRGVQYFTDFDNNGTAVPNLQSFINGTGANTNRQVASVPNQLNNQIGFCQYQTGTTSTGYATHTTEGWVGRQFLFGGGSWIFETFICVETLSDVTNRFRFVTGFGDGATNSSDSNACIFTYDEGGIQNGTIASPNYQCVTSVGGVRTLTTTSIVVTAGAWTRLRIEVNASGTSVSFFINGNLIATHTTNIPTFISWSNNRGFNVKQSIVKATGTTNRSVFCDYLGYENRLTTPRT